MKISNVKRQVSLFFSANESRKHLFFAVFIISLVGSFLFFSGMKKSTPPPQVAKVAALTPTPTPKKDEPFGTYTPPKIPKKDVYIIFMVGDSMTETLGTFGGSMDEFINASYQSTPGHKRVVIDNYAKGATNILGLPEAMTKKTTSGDTALDPLLSRSFDLILIESFGYNPLSQLGVEEGLKKQTKTLDEVMKTLTATHPNSAIVFVATIAPSKEKYAIIVNPNTTAAERTQQVEERMAYIKNHISYAKAHNIPVINIFEKSFNEQGDGNLKYINPYDYIHPSVEGVDFINHELANYIYDNQILPR